MDAGQYVDRITAEVPQDRQAHVCRILTRVYANTVFMDGMEAAMEARARDERGVPFEELKRKPA